MHFSKPDRLKFIYWFSFYNLDSPSVRYRAKYPLDYLKSHSGINSYFITPGYSFSNILLFARAYISALLFRKRSSAIVIQKVHSDFIYANLLKFLISVRKKNTFYDIDDADYLEYPPENIYYFIKRCSCVITASNELQKNLAGFNKRIILNTSPVPVLNIYKSSRNETLTIGWIGCFAGGHKESLHRLFFPSLKSLSFKVKLVILGVKNHSDRDSLIEYFNANENVELTAPFNIDWQNERDIQHRISEFDIGIATLFDDELHRSKSAFKLKQYFNNGVPVLSSEIPENNIFIRNGVNGYFCNSPEEFRKRIEEMKYMSDTDFKNMSENAISSTALFDLKNYSKIFQTAYEEGIKGEFNELIHQKL